MSTASRTAVAERTYTCSDGLRLAARHWSNVDAATSDDEASSRRRTRKIICLHGWLDNAASFDRLAPLLLDAQSSCNDATTPASTSAIPTEIVALDFPGHGLSGHKSVDGPPQLLAEYAYYVSELIEALQWGGKGSNTGGNRGPPTTADGGIDGKITPVGSGGETEQSTTVAADGIILMGHSMGSGVATVLCAAFPELFSALILLEGGLMARDADDAPRHVRAACQRRMRSNKTLFPDGSSSNGDTAPPRARVYASLDAAIEARLRTAGRMPGEQWLSFEAARDMVLRATAPANAAAVGAAVVFRHDPRLQWPSLQYYTREQVASFFRHVRAAGTPVCFLSAADGWPVDAGDARVIAEVLRPGCYKRLSGSHHLHSDPDSVGAVANEIVLFMEDQQL